MLFRSLKIKPPFKKKKKKKDWKWIRGFKSSESTRVTVEYIYRRTRDIRTCVPANSCFTSGGTFTRINGRMTTGSPVWPGKIIRSSIESRGRDSRVNGDIRAITPTLRPTARRITSASAAAVRTRSFVRTARYSIRRDWSVRGGTPWIAPARKVSTPLTRRLQKQWRKLIGEHALRNELFKIHTRMRPYGIRDTITQSVSPYLPRFKRGKGGEGEKEKPPR